MVIMAHSNTLYTNNKNQQVLICISYLKQQELNTIQHKITTYTNADTALIKVKQSPYRPGVAQRVPGS